MRILLINVPHPAIGSRIPDDHLPPFGLLSIRGPLIDDGHQVRLLDAEFGPMPLTAVAPGYGRSRCRRSGPSAASAHHAQRKSIPSCRLWITGADDWTPESSAR
ncbi:hypothetical protein ACVW1C_003776 [Bradyrhizobium sp. USDA 4011]